MDPYKILKHPLSTEKAVRLMESDNKLTFIVDRKSNKTQIKQSFEKLFNTKPLKITTLITPQGKKKAYIKLPTDKPAIDIATQLGLI